MRSAPWPCALACDRPRPRARTRLTRTTMHCAHKPNAPGPTWRSRSAAAAASRRARAAAACWSSSRAMRSRRPDPASRPRTPPTPSSPSRTSPLVPSLFPAQCSPSASERPAGQPSGASMAMTIGEASPIDLTIGGARSLASSAEPFPTVSDARRTAPRANLATASPGDASPKIPMSSVLLLVAGRARIDYAGVDIPRRSKGTVRWNPSPASAAAIALPSMHGLVIGRRLVL